jgi:predicted GNAT family N-acyltransferase
MDVAKDLFQKESMFNEKARQYLLLAYRQMTNGKKYESPKELDEFITPAEHQEKGRKYGQKLVESALAEIDAGKPGEAARLLLELVLMIVTPISG